MTLEKIIKLKEGTRVCYYRPKSVEHGDEGQVLFGLPMGQHPARMYIRWDDGCIMDDLTIPNRAFRYIRILSLPK
jgi:hypothetical protein